MYLENIYHILFLIFAQLNRNVIKNGKMSNERAIDTPADLSQPQVDDMSLKHISTREVYVHLMNTAYELALNVSRAV